MCDAAVCCPVNRRRLIPLSGRSSLYPVENTVAHKYYRIVFPTLRGAGETLMQIAEVELIGIPVESVPSGG